MTIPRAGFLLTGLAALALAGWFLMSREAERETNPDLASLTIPALSDEAAQGKALFDANCATCHGANGAGSNQGPPLVHRIYEPGHHGDMAFILAARQGVRAHHWKFGNMPAVEGVSDAEVARIVAYIRAIQRANGIN